MRRSRRSRIDQNPAAEKKSHTQPSPSARLPLGVAWGHWEDSGRVPGPGRVPGRVPGWNPPADIRRPPCSGGTRRAEARLAAWAVPVAAATASCGRNVGRDR